MWAVRGRSEWGTPRHYRLPASIGDMFWCRARRPRIARCMCGRALFSSPPRSVPSAHLVVRDLCGGVLGLLRGRHRRRHKDEQGSCAGKAGWGAWRESAVGVRDTAGGERECLCASPIHAPAQLRGAAIEREAPHALPHGKEDSTTVRGGRVQALSMRGVICATNRNSLRSQFFRSSPSLARLPSTPRTTRGPPSSAPCGLCGDLCLPPATAPPPDDALGASEDVEQGAH